jgi:signal transduction histidine kinase
MTRRAAWVSVGAVPRVLRSDLALALALAVPSVAQVLIWPIAPRPVGVVIALWTTLPIAWRRRRPLAAAFAVTLPAFYPTDGYVVFGYVAYFVAFYSAAAYAEDRRAMLAVVAFGVVASVAASWLNHEVAGEYFGALSAVVLPAVAGGAVRHQRAQSARVAAAEERARIARELHDVVSHSLSVIAIQASAAEAAVERDPTLAGPPLAAIRSSAEEALGDMRRMLGVLRDTDDGSDRVPQPGLARLPELVEHARAAGVDVTLEVAGTPRPLPPSVDLSAFRIVQEALTNVRKHASGAPTTVRVGWEPSALALAVRDRGPGAASAQSSGHGLVGMRERVRLHGGELRAGPAADGGFEVAAVLPL